MSDPVQGSGERIAKRARLPLAALLAYPLIDVAAEYLLFLRENAVEWVPALKQVQQDFALLTFLVALPTVILAFLRELQVHILIDKFLGVQASVETIIVELMADLADRSGYDHPDRIRQNALAAKEWFYSYVNKSTETRARAFEVWEGYYVSLYLSAGSLVSFLMCLSLALVFPVDRTLLVATLPFMIFLALWATRHWSTVPKMKRIPVQQMADVKPSGEVLSEARRRFNAS